MIEDGKIVVDGTYESIKESELFNELEKAFKDSKETQNVERKKSDSNAEIKLPELTKKLSKNDK